MKSLGNSLMKEIVRNKFFYILIIPAVIYYIVFAYVPMYGIQLAFKEFDYSKGILGSPWIGLTNFIDVFSDPDFKTAFINTLTIGLGRIVFEFPVPILVALMINEISRKRLKKLYQTVFTFPHFLSWIVISGILFNFLGDSGAVNNAIAAMGFQKVNFLGDPLTFRALIFISDSWKEMGFNCIIYLAAIAGINPEMYEAAYLDGAGRFRQVAHITWPSIKNVAVVLLILAVGSSLNNGFDQIFNLYNPGVYQVSDIIDTYVYRRTFVLGASFGSSTAVGLFKSVINFMLLISADFLAKRFGEDGLL
jgi:putative aldouronate transport system permease protein